MLGGPFGISLGKGKIYLWEGKQRVGQVKRKQQSALLSESVYPDQLRSAGKAQYARVLAIKKALSSVLMKR